MQVQKKEYDIVIVGSGASGGVMAKELSPLCKQGAKIALLEWGPKLKPEEYSGHELEMVSRLYFEGGGVLTEDRSITIAMGKAYGGSTVVYTGTSFIIPEEILEDWAVPGLEFADIEARSNKYFEENNVHLTPPELINENNSLFKEACEKLGYSVGQFPVNIRNCKGAGVCNLGCPNDAKMGTHVVQLPEAEKNGVEVITNCKVDRLGEKRCYAHVRNPDFGFPSPWEEGLYEIKAKQVVLCAGAIHTPALIQKSQLPVQSQVLGKYITLHPALILVGQHDRTITNYHGHPKSYFSDQFVKSDRFIIETCMYFPFMTSKSLTGYGSEHAQIMEDMRKLQQILVLAFDEPERDNYITIDKKGNPVVHYTLSNKTKDALFRSMVTCAKILFASGAKRVNAPAGTKFFIEDSEQGSLEQLMSRERMKPGKVSISSAHIMGGCRMGTNPENSVTDSFGNVRGVPWLRVADASLFPKCSEVNPYITIMALADRIAENIRENAGELLGK